MIVDQEAPKQTTAGLGDLIQSTQLFEEHARI